jgi:hypothetical protein
VTRTTPSTDLVVFNLDLNLAVDAPVVVRGLEALDVRDAEVEVLELARWAEGVDAPFGIVEQWPYPGLDPVPRSTSGDTVLEDGERDRRLVLSVGLRTRRSAASSQTSRSTTPSPAPTGATWSPTSSASAVGKPTRWRAPGGAG